MNIDEAARILLNGISGCNISEVCRLSGVSSRNVIHRFLTKPEVKLRGGDDIDKLFMFIWRQLNAHLLISPEDFPESKVQEIANLDLEDSPEPLSKAVN